MIRTVFGRWTRAPPGTLRFMMTTSQKTTGSFSSWRPYGPFCASVPEALLLQWWTTLRFNSIIWELHSVVRRTLNFVTNFHPKVWSAAGFIWFRAVWYDSDNKVVIEEFSARFNEMLGAFLDNLQVVWLPDLWVHSIKILADFLQVQTFQTVKIINKRNWACNMRKIHSFPPDFGLDLIRLARYKFYWV